MRDAVISCCSVAAMLDLFLAQVLPMKRGKEEEEEGGKKKKRYDS